MIHTQIQNPVKGQPMRASWGQSVAEGINAHERALQALNKPAKWTSLRENSELTPFLVRYHEGQWEIYLPDGCVNVNGSCEALNPLASDTGSAHEDDGSAWRLLAVDESNATTGTDGDGNTYKQFLVTVHAKLSAKIYGTDGVDDPARKLLWAGTRDELNRNPTDAQRYKDTPGDYWSCRVARIVITEVTDSDTNETTTTRTVTQLRTTAVDVSTTTATAAFDLEWYLSGDNGELTVEQLVCVRQTGSGAGVTLTGPTMTDVTGVQSTIDAKIDTTALVDGGRGVITVLADQTTTTSTDYVLWLRLYELTCNTVTADYRSTALANVQIFHS